MTRLKKLAYALFFIVITTALFARISIEFDSVIAEPTHPTYQLQMTKLLDEFSLIAKINPVFRYWLISGSLLGLLRHNQSFIPHDDDLDVGIDEDSHNLLKSDPNISKLISDRGLLLCYNHDISKLRFKGHNTPFLDIILYSKHGDFMLPPDYFWDEYFKISELFPLQKCTLSNVDVFCPISPMPYIKRHFGSTATWLLYGSHWTIPQIPSDWHSKTRSKVYNYTNIDNIMRPNCSNPIY